MVNAPGTVGQWLNAIVHKEPISSIVYFFYWSFLLISCIPIAISVLMLQVTFRLYVWITGRGVGDFDPPQNKNKELAVMITGCDSGFGKELALIAADAGYVVFAGCLKESSFAQFEGTGTKSVIFPIKMDVTSKADVVYAAVEVSKWINNSAAKPKKRVLHALVNNAGVGEGGDIDWSKLEAFERMMNINYFGTVTCCKAFLPIFKQQSVGKKHSGSRIFNVASVSGRVAAGTGLGLYSPSKHATAAFSSFLRREMAGFGIQVTTVNPSFHGTPLVATMQDRITETWGNLSKDTRKEYGEGKLIFTVQKRHGSDSHYVVNISI
jgi:3-hydroxybutyrate dehydrogenase